VKRKLLIDTHILIWMALQPDKLSLSAKQNIESAEVLYLSYVSVWEMAIKISIGKLNIEFELETFIDMAREKHQMKLLSISTNDIYYIQSLPHHHKDPFDRLIAAQSLVLDIPLVSSDEIFDADNVKRLWQ